MGKWCGSAKNLVYSLDQNENNQELFEQICPFVPQLRDEPNKLE